MFIYRTPAPVHRVSILMFFVKSVLLTEGTDVSATKLDSLARRVRKVKCLHDMAKETTITEKEFKDVDVLHA